MTKASDSRNLAPFLYVFFTRVLSIKVEENGYRGCVKGVENTIRNIGELAKKGMRETDKTIIQIMTR